MDMFSMVSNDYSDISEELGIYVKDSIHAIATTDGGVYDRLYCGSGLELTKYVFNFNFGLTHNPKFDTLERGYDEIAMDMRFLLDNIVAKIVELNMDVNYRKTKRLGGTLTLDGQRYENHYLVDDYVLSGHEGIADLENYLDDLNVSVSQTSSGYRYNVSIELPIYDIRENISLLNS